MTSLKISNPATGAPITEVAVDDAASVAEKMVRARAAQPRWAALPLAERQACIARFRAGVESGLETLAATLTAEVGKPIRQSRNELNGLLGRIDFFLAEVERATAAETVFADASVTERIGHDPLGVIANISAWNYPYFVGGNVFVPALLTGNAVLYKPSEYATLTGQHIARLLHDAGVPTDVFTTLVGTGETGAALLAQPVDGVFFTGSAGTGAKIAAAVGARMIRLQLELGGKDPTYVCDDANAAAAAESLADGAMYNTGQSCCSVERIYVHERIHDAFVDAFLATVRGFRIGDPTDEATYIGAITRAPQLQVLEDQVADALAKGARLQTGGHRIAQAGQLVRADGVHRGRPHDGADARRELRPDHRHPAGPRRRRGAGADERHALWPDGRRLHARRGAGRGDPRARQRRQRLLELLRPREPAPAVVGARRLRRRRDVVDLRHPDLHATARVAPAHAVTAARSARCAA